MNVALINPEYPSSGADHGGIATYTYVMANAIADQGHSVHVLAKQGTVPDSLHPKVHFHTFGRGTAPPFRRLLERLCRGNVRWEKGFSRGALEKALELHRARALQVVEIPEYNGLAYSFRGSRLPFPVVIHLHTPSCVVDHYNQIAITSRHRAWYRFEERAADSATALVAPSNAIRAEITKHFAIAQERIIVIRHPVDRGLFDKLARRGRREDRIELLFVGRLERRKGAEFLVRAIPAILAADPRIRITFAGLTETGNAPLYRETIERNLPDLERKRVWFLGPVRREQLPSLYVNSDVFLFPSLFENAPYALFEAISAGLPVVGADAEGTREIISHNRNGLLFKVNDQPSLLVCLERLIADAGLGRRLADAAREDLKNVYDNSKAAVATISFYESLRTNWSRK